MIARGALKRLGGDDKEPHVVRDPIPSIPLRPVTEVIYCKKIKKKIKKKKPTEKQHALIISINGGTPTSPVLSRQPECM